MVDLLIQFNVAYEKDGVVIEDRRRIVVNYLLGSFLIDLVSAVPWDVLSAYSEDFLYVHTITVLIRLSRLRRMRSLQTQIEKLQYRIDNKLIWVFVNVAKLFSILMLLAHWFACLWYFLGASTASDDPEAPLNWFSTATIDRTSFVSCYLTSLYFCITTMITVGYGDVHAVNLQEKLFAISLMMTAWMVLLVISGVLTSTIVRYDEQGARFSEMMNRSMKYMIKNNIDSELQSFVRTFLLQQIEHEATEEVHEELMTHLDSSSRMKSEVYVGLWGKYLRRYGWFSRFPSHLLGNVCSGCVMMRFSPGDLVIRAGNIGDGMYFVIKGRLLEKRPPNPTATNDAKNSVPEPTQTKRKSTLLQALEHVATITPPPTGGLSETTSDVIGEVSVGEFFGERSLFIPTKWLTQFECETYCEVLFVPSDKVVEWMRENEEYMLLYRNQKAISALLPKPSDNAANLPAIFLECIKEGIDANYIDHENNALLHTAIKAENFLGIQELLWRGARSNFVDVSTNKYPLQLAIATKDLAIIDVVAEYSDMTALAEGDNPPIGDLLNLTGNLAAFAANLIMFAAAASGYHRVISYILDKCGGDKKGGVNDVFRQIEGVGGGGSSSYEIGQRYNGFCLADIAAKNGHSEVIDTLCDHQADFNYGVNERSRLPLHYAVEAGSKGSVSHLVKHGALTVLRDREGLTPLDLALKLETEEKDFHRLQSRRAITLMLRGLNLHDLSKDGKIEELRSAIADKCDPNIIHPKTGRTPLQYAADANQVNVIKELLANRAEIDFTGVSQVTALYSALMKGHLDSSQALLEGSADPNKTLPNGSTPLMAAIKKGSMPLVDLLLRFGAIPGLDDVKTAFEKKDKAMVVKMRSGWLASRRVPPSEDLTTGKDYGIWEPYLSQKESMFHQFCRKADVAIVNMAIEFNADITSVNGDGLSPMDIAANLGKDKVVDILFKAAKSFMNENELKEYMTSGLLSACRNPKGTMVTIKLLIALGADLVYRSPLDTAIRSSHVEATKYFMESGLDVGASITAETIMWLSTTDGQFETLKNLMDKIFAVGSTLDKDRVRRDWKVFDAAHKASEMGKNDVMKYLCDQFSIDEAIVSAAGGLGYVAINIPINSAVQEVPVVRQAHVDLENPVEEMSHSAIVVERKKSSMIVSRLSSRLSDTRKKASGIFSKLISKSLKRN